MISTAFRERSVERLKAAPYGTERDGAAVGVLEELSQQPGMARIVKEARSWGIEEDSYALEKLLEELEKGERDLRKLAQVATPLLAEDKTLRRQLGSLDCKLGAELWDATSSKQLRQTIHRNALYGEEPPLQTAWSLKTHMKFTNPPDKEAIAGVIFRATERHPEQKWVVESLRSWDKPLNWATLEKACEVWSKGGPNELALLVTDPKDFAMQSRQMTGSARALHEVIAEPKRHYLWSCAMRKPTEWLRDYMGYHYSNDPSENAAVYRTVWPDLRQSASGQLMERWGLTNIEAVKWAAQQPDVKDPWHVALSVTPDGNSVAMERQVRELDTPIGKLAAEMWPHLRTDQHRKIWERALRSKNTEPEHVQHTLLATLNQTGVDDRQSLALVKLLWRDLERTSEQIPVTLTFASSARGEGFNYVLDRLLARPILSNEVRAGLTALRAEGGDWTRLKPLLEKMRKDAGEEDEMRKLIGEKRDPTLGIKEQNDAIEVGGVRLPKRGRPASPGP